MTSGSLYFKLLKEDFRRRLWAIALVFLAFFFTLPIGLALNMENAANTNYYRYNDYEPFIQDAAMTDLQYKTRLLELKTEVVLSGVEHAIAIAIKNILGLVCDPVAGLVEIPCIKRNASGVAGAFVAAELALAGIESAIPADEVIWTMKKVGDAMSSTLKETAEGGLAATPTGRRLHEQVFGTVREPKSGCSGCGGCSS